MWRIGIIFVLALAACSVREERTLYRDVAVWIEDYALPAERVGVLESAKRYFAGREAVLLLEDDDAFALLATLREAQPDFVVAWPGIAWDGVRAQPWFQSHYRLFEEMVAPSQPQISLDIFAYTPSPFDGGDIVLLGLPVYRDVLELCAVRVSQPRLTPGAPLYVTLFWDGDFPVQFDAGRLTLRLVPDATARSEDARPLVQLEETLVDGHPPNFFRGGEALFSQHILGVPSDLSEGSYRLTLALDLVNGEPLLDEGFTLAQFAHFIVTTDVPVMDFSGGWHFGDVISLVGYDVPARVTRGEVLRVALYWHARDVVPGNYTVFIHMLDAEGNLVAQSDAVPVNWTYPTMQWRAGEYIRDEHILTLDAALPRGDYTLLAGLYDAETGVRLNALSAKGQPMPENHVELRVVKAR